MHLALVHEDDFVADFARKAHFMRDHDQRHALLGQTFHHAQHFSDQLRVQRRGDFIAKQNLRPHRQGPGNGHALLLTAGELVGHGIEFFGQAYALQQLFCLGAGRAPGLVHHQGGRQHHVAAHAEVGEEIKALKNHAHVFAQIAQRLCVAGLQFLTVHAQLALLKIFQPIDAAQQCAFAGTAFADDADHFAAADLQVHAFQYFVAAKAFAQTLNIDQRKNGRRES